MIIPTLNAARHLPRTLAPLVDGVAHGIVRQVVISDGGSVDETLEIADAAGCDIVSGPAGRAKQMRAGVAVARAQWLLFLHADTTLGAGWTSEVERFMAHPNATQRAGAFTLAFDDDSVAARRVVYWARLRARMLKLPYGDQGLLISRALYDEIGGFRDMPLMEDVDIVRRIGGRRLSLLSSQAITSAEKYRRDGFGKRAWRNLGLTTRYLLGADPAALAKAYD